MKNKNPVMNANVGTKATGQLLWLPAVAALFLIGTIGDAQSWKDELKAEQAKNATRIAAIDAEAQPLANQLKQVMSQVDRHNQHGCTYPPDHPEVCAAYDREAEDLNTAKQNLLNRLIPLASESDGLIARNKEIDRKLRCIPLPKACTSDSDCNSPCSACGDFDSRIGQRVCQPRP